MWIFIFSIFGAYLAIGIAVTAILSQTPYADIGWWFTILLWPLFVIAMVR